MKRLLIAALLLCAPLSAAAAAKPSATTTPPAAVPVVAAAFDYPQMTSLTSTPLITGTTTNLHMPLRLTITAADGRKAFNDAVATTSSSWHTVVYPPLVEGSYKTALVVGTTTLARGQLAIGAVPPQIARDTSLGAFDVSDGKLIRFSVRSGPNGTALAQLGFNVVPTAVDLSTLTLYGFTDSAYSQPIASSTDGTLGNTTYDASSPAVVVTPEDPVLIPPRTTYYFELDGDVSPSDMAYSVETTLLGDRAEAQPATLAQMLGNNFVWSPQSFGTSSADVADWLNGASVPDLYPSLDTERFSLPSVSCNLALSTTSIATAGPVTLTWQSVGVEHAAWLGGATAPLSGTATYIASSTTTYGINFWGAAGSTQCTATLYYQTPYVAPPSGGGTSTTTATTTSPYGSFAVTPSSGTAPLATIAAGTVNANKSCAAITYTLGYGDSSTTTINVGKNICKAQTFSLTHTFSAVGTYTVRLYAGTFATSTPPLVQSITVTVTKKVSYNPQTMLAGAAAAWQSAWAVLLRMFGK